MSATITPYLAPHALDRTKVAAQVDLVEDANWKITMENNRECYHCDGHPELVCTFFPTWGLEDHQVPPRLRAAHDRYLAAEDDLAEFGCAGESLHGGRPVGRASGRCGMGLDDHSSGSHEGRWELVVQANR